MATRVTLPPLDPIEPPTAGATEPAAPEAAPHEAPGSDQLGAERAPVPVSKVQLLNDRGDREAEAAWLRAAARPGVVPLLSTSSDPFTIVTAHSGSRTLRTARVSPLEGLRLITAVADLVAGLHRDGFVHGKLTVDHVILGSSGPVLCSPDGTVTDPDADLSGLARCMVELGRQWDDARATVAWRQRWDRLAQRLDDGSDPARSATRAAHALRRMLPAAGEEPASPAVTTRRRPSPGLIAAAATTLLALSGLALVPTNREPTSAGPRLDIDGATYAVGAAGDDAVHLDHACDPEATVVLLRPATGEVWVFPAIGDQATGAIAAVVPGATELRAEHRSERGCDVAVARGPAGATDIDTARLTGNAIAAEPLLDD